MLQKLLAQQPPAQQQNSMQQQYSQVLNQILTF